MKYILSTLMIMLSIIASANEDHLVLVPTMVQDEGDGGEIYIVQVPIVSGYGANFEGYIGRITRPYIAEYHSPSTKIKNLDLNPASLAGISLSAVLAKDNFYDIKIDYTKVKGDWLTDRRLLRSVITCIYDYGDRMHYPNLKARLKIVGIPANSTLHGELLKCVEQRKLTRKK